MRKNIYLKKIKNHNLLTQDNLTYHNLQATFLWGWQYFFLELNALSYEFPEFEKNKKIKKLQKKTKTTTVKLSRHGLAIFFFCDMVKL